MKRAARKGGFSLARVFDGCAVRRIELADSAD
jgi:hypothetical protein